MGRNSKRSTPAVVREDLDESSEGWSERSTCFSADGSIREEADLDHGEEGLGLLLRDKR